MFNTCGGSCSSALPAYPCLPRTWLWWHGGRAGARAAYAQAPHLPQTPLHIPSTRSPAGSAGLRSRRCLTGPLAACPFGRSLRPLLLLLLLLQDVRSAECGHRNCLCHQYKNVICACGMLVEAAEVRPEEGRGVGIQRRRELGAQARTAHLCVASRQYPLFLVSGQGATDGAVHMGFCGSCGRGRSAVASWQFRSSKEEGLLASNSHGLHGERKRHQVTMSPIACQTKGMHGMLSQTPPIARVVLPGTLHLHHLPVSCVAHAPPASVMCCTRATCRLLHQWHACTACNTILHALRATQHSMPPTKPTNLRLPNQLWCARSRVSAAHHPMNLGVCAAHHSTNRHLPVDGQAKHGLHARPNAMASAAAAAAIAAGACPIPCWCNS